MLASKRVDTKKIWSLDDIDTISKDLHEKLKLHDVQSDQNKHQVWNFKVVQNKNHSYDMYGEPLSPDIINISENSKIKMKQYYEIMEMKGRVIEVKCLH